MRLANDLSEQRAASYQQLACIAVITFVFPIFPNSRMSVLVKNGPFGIHTLRMSSTETSLHRQKPVFGLPFDKNRMIVGLFLFKLYHNVMERQTDRIIAINKLSRADVR